MSDIAFDLSVYLVGNEGVAQSAGMTLEESIEQALRGGTSFVQIREKDMSPEQLTRLSQKVLRLTKKAGVPLVINDDVEVALAVDADGVHVGQSDMSAREVRQLIGEHRILGVSAYTVAQAKKAEADGADYIGIGPVFLTKTKRDADAPMGLETLEEITNSVSIPTVAIGGITPINATSVMQAGVDGLAVISAIIGQGDPEAASRCLLRMVKGGNKISRVV